MTEEREHTMVGTKTADTGHPLSHPVVIDLLKVMIVIGEALCLFGQWLVIELSGEIVRDIPETSPGLGPYRVAGVLGIVCVEVALAALWPLLTLTAHRDIFSGRALVWIDLIVGCACVEGVLVLAVLIFSNLSLPYTKPDGTVIPAAIGAPMLELMLAAALLVILAFILLMRVMRSLLVQAIDQRQELEAVI